MVWVVAVVASLLSAGLTVRAVERKNDGVFDLPDTVLHGACTFLAATSGEGAWITIRNALRSQATVQRPAVRI